MPDERFEPMGIAAGLVSDRETGRWHGDGGEGVRLCLKRRARQDSRVLQSRRDGMAHMQDRRPKAPQAFVNQNRQHNHFAQIRLPE